ncbi:MAG: ABC transporter permease [Tannerella sp.]|jgi:sulfonate transport system permease protein|nr:ABC transporter permease [Tannerella sp.]
MIQNNLKGDFLRTSRKHAENIVIQCAVPILLIGVWELCSDLGLAKSTLLPPPSLIFSTFIDLLLSGELFHHLGISIWRVLQGYVIGAFSGILIGVLCGLFKRIDTSLSLVLGFLRPIPVIAWVPVFILWMGIDEASKITVIAIGSFWPVLVNVIDGIRHVDKKYLEVARILEKNNWQILTKVIFPSALPNIFTGLRVGIGIAWMCVVGAELIAASSGIGYLIMYARELLQSDVMYVGVFSIGLTGFLIDKLLRLIERKLLKWNINK